MPSRRWPISFAWARCIRRWHWTAGISRTKSKSTACWSRPWPSFRWVDLILAQAVGTDVDAILVELEDVYGDPLNGQLLYNGLEPALGGSALGCAGCHENEAVAPLTSGTWTRVDAIRLALPAFAEYSHRRFLVESIVQPMAYITPDYAGMMPEIYGRQLTTQQLADLVAFLDSQDQLLEGG